MGSSFSKHLVSCGVLLNQSKVNKGKKYSKGGEAILPGCSPSTTTFCPFHSSGLALRCALKKRHFFCRVVLFFWLRWVSWAAKVRLLALPASFLGLLKADCVCVALCWFGDAESRRMKGRMSCGNLQLGSWCDLGRELFNGNYCLAFNILGASLTWNFISDIWQNPCDALHGWWEGTLEISRLPSSCLSRVLRAVSSLVLSISNDGDATISLGPDQCLTMLIANMFPCAWLDFLMLQLVSCVLHSIPVRPWEEPGPSALHLSHLLPHLSESASAHLSLQVTCCSTHHLGGLCWTPFCMSVVVGSPS